MSGFPAPDDPRAPKYWMDETSGELEKAVHRYLRNESLTLRDLALLGAYLRQWTDSPVWDMNPHLTDVGRAELAALRRQVRGARTRKEIDLAIARLIEEGIDPL